MSARCKLTCQSVTRSKNWQQHEGQPTSYLFTAKFHAVTGNSEENKKFFAATPSAQVELGVLNQDLFEPGKDYFFEISEAP